MTVLPPLPAAPAPPSNTTTPPAGRAPSGTGSVLDEALARVTDPGLRAVLEQEVERLRDSRRFGLVFDRHLPESVRLADHPLRKGITVGLRDGSDDRTWRVTAFTDSSRQTAILDDGSEQPVSALVVIREFGEPVYPGLKSVERIDQAATDAPVHAVINGENYHVLQALRTTHRGKVDLIYIDPPYNTGNDSWIYNDRYIDGNDRSRSSKWLSFMERRLLIARELLKPTGIIVVAIGDDEQHRLRMLLDQVFEPQNFLANVVWQGSAKNDARYTGGGVDYMLMYARNEEALTLSGVRWREAKPGLELASLAASKAWTDSGHDAEGATRLYRAALRGLKDQLEPAVFRYDQIDEEGRVFQNTSLVSPNPRPNLRYDIIHPVTGRATKMHPNGWRYSPDAMQELVASDQILFGSDETTTPRLKRYLSEQGEQVPQASFKMSRLAGSKRLEQILGDRRFPFPKDHEVLMRWFRTIAPSNGVILDFFGGSGTTTEAVLRLNEEDHGSRQSILVTNNEVGAKQAKALRKAGHHPGDPEWEAQGVFEHVTRPRLSTVVTGQRPDGSTYSDGLTANIEFFNLTYLDPGMVRRGREFATIAPLLWLEAGAVGPRIDIEPDAGWALTAQYGVLFTVDALRDFADAVVEATLTEHAPRVLFIITDSPSEYQHARSRLPAGVETVQLYEDYLTRYTINTDGGFR